MTDLAPATAAAPARPVPPYADPTTTAAGRPRPRSRGRAVIAAVMATSLALSAGARYWADAKRTAAVHSGSQEAVSSTSLSNMDSFALGLLLGGLRGPLVMILWTDSENQKSSRNLEGVDTEIEWIRLLQPEFDTVHLFQIWNKAYNISVQMASLGNKYSTILGALDYAHQVDRQKPDDINIVASVGQLFFDKLGTSSEKGYYRMRVRQDSVQHAAAAPGAGAAEYRITTLQPAVDATGHLLADRRADLSALFAPPEIAELGPYTDGLSTFALAYNYYKRSDDLMLDKYQHHDQLSDVVIDSRPGLALKNWADDEVQRGRIREGQALGRLPQRLEDAVSAVTNAADVDLFTAAAGPADVSAGPDGAARAGQLAQAIDAYDRAAKLVPAALREYERHIRNYPDKEQQYKLYMEEAKAEQQLAAGDRDFLEAMRLIAAGPQQDASLPTPYALLADARSAYERARVRYDLINLRYYTDYRIQAQVIPPGFGTQPGAPNPIENMSPAQVLAVTAAVYKVLGNSPIVTDPTSDWNEYQVHVHRIEKRLATIDAAK